MSPFQLAFIGALVLVIGFIGVESSQDNGLTGSETDHGRNLRGNSGCIAMAVGLILLVIAFIAELT